MASSVVKRYGKAILEIASETKKIDNWISNFKDSEQIIQDDDLYSFLSSPQVPTSEKLNSIDTLMKGYEALFVNFLKVFIKLFYIYFKIIVGGISPPLENFLM